VDIEGNVTLVSSETTGVVVEEDNHLIVTDDYSEHDVEISKVDVNGEEISGAELKVTDKDGNEISSWTSDGNPHVISVKPGTYTFEETAAPSGYEVVSKFEFTVDIEGNVTLVSSETTGVVVEEDNHLIVTDDYSEHDVEISKVDVDGNVVDSWTSVEGESHTVTVKPGTYTFHEVSAPDGYVTVTDITFSVDKDGNVTVITDTTTGTKTVVDGNKLIITDEKETPDTPTPTPETPTPTPELPETPDTPKPELPKTPDTPKPELPETPDTPKPQLPRTYDDTENNSVNTGVSSPVRYLGIGIAAILALLLADKKRRK
jgi:tetrahydromethanopterin S-methyltransferase subunit B